GREEMKPCDGSPGHRARFSPSDRRPPRARAGPPKATTVCATASKIPLFKSPGGDGQHAAGQKREADQKPSQRNRVSGRRRSAGRRRFGQAGKAGQQERDRFEGRTSPAELEQRRQHRPVAGNDAADEERASEGGRERSASDKQSGEQHHGVDRRERERRQG